MKYFPVHNGQIGGPMKMNFDYLQMQKRGSKTVLVQKAEAKMGLLVLFSHVCPYYGP